MRRTRRYLLLGATLAWTSWGVSLVIDFRLPLLTKDVGTCVEIYGGAVSYRRMEFTSHIVDAPHLQDVYSLLLTRMFPKRTVYWSSLNEQHRWLPEIGRKSAMWPAYDGPQLPYTSTSLVLPLWLPAVLLSAAAGLFAYRSRTRLQAGCCRRCSYNLTGNTSGICPECGTPVPDEIKEKLAADPPKQ